MRRHNTSLRGSVQLFDGLGADASRKVGRLSGESKQDLTSVLGIVRTERPASGSATEPRRATS